MHATVSDDRATSETALPEESPLYDEELPIRGVPFSAEHLEEHARELAQSHVVVASHPDEKRLWYRFQSNSETLQSIYDAIVTAVHAGEEISQGSEWLLDNFYVVREQLREIHEDLPPRFYRELPKLSQGVFAGYPRVYALAMEVIAHTDSALDAAVLIRFIKAYQEVAPLTIGELWAVPIALRLGLVENLRRLADRVLVALDHRRCADRWADEIIDARPVDPHAVLTERTKATANLRPPLVARMVQRFRDQGHDLSECWHWLEQRLAAEGQSVEDIVRHEHQRQARDQVSIGNAITAMRWLSAIDWTWVFEDTSLVEQELRRDPAGMYARMDFATRDRYRHVIEVLGRRSKLPELEVTRRVVQMANTAAADSVEQHVGYYLIDDGRPVIEARLQAKVLWHERLRRFAARQVTVIYLGAISVLWSALLAIPLTYAASLGLGLGALVLLALLWSIPLSELSVAIVNYLATVLVHPQPLPKLDFRQRVPDAYPTMVVIPTLLLSKENVRGLLERLEIHYLANPQPQLKFALLADFKDADAATLPEDAELLAEAEAGIAQLNERHGRENGQRFWLFHRARQWNPVQNKWMGWERKRGKLSEFNRYLRGDLHTSYVGCVTLPEELAKTRFVITLDSDTQLPLGAAAMLISTLAHPLNLPRLNAAHTQLTRGYAVLQPRITINPATANRSPFARIYSGNPHVDPYVTAVSDVYQDLFNQGSYIGKGIYDLDAFEEVLGEAFPENSILSHDLIESCHARTALVTDIEFVDDFPLQYHAYARRQHRWVRGDWQLLPWLGLQTPTAHGRRRNPLNAISHWKVFDNLRRSLAPVAIMVALVASWFALPGAAWLWMALALLSLGAPLVVQATAIALGRPASIPWLRYLRESATNFRLAVLQTLLSLAFLPHQAYLMIDAVTRTVARLWFTRRQLLEWETAYATEKRLGRGLKFFIVEMWAAPVVAILVIVALAIGQPPSFVVALPIALLWLVSPAIAYQVSQPVARQPLPLTDEQRRELRQIARRTWHFYQRFVTADDNWLPPDNFQEVPKRVIAHRTSPTNEGMFLTSVAAAHDFGYLGFGEVISWLERNLDSWDKTERFRGHPLNWYDTQTLQVLAPGYVSTVDSGNLAAAALTMRQTLHEFSRVPILGGRALAGIYDGLGLLGLTKPGESSAIDESSVTPTTAQLVEKIKSAEQTMPRNPVEWQRAWQPLERALGELLHLPVSVARNGSPSLIPDTFHAQALRGQIEELRAEFDALFPWVALFDEPDCPVPLPSSAARSSDTATPLDALRALLSRDFSLTDVENLPQALAAIQAELREPAATLTGWLTSLSESAERGAAHAASLRRRSDDLAERLRELALVMDFTFLFDAQRKLFSIGYNLSTGQLDRSHYDLLASEARLASFLAIGKGDVDHRHWFHLGRPMTQVGASNALLSWGGTMFEYLMPNLFLRSYDETLLTQSCVAATQRQIEYGRQQHLVWGISESAFAAFDNAANYQYRSFGVPGLGLKRGLADDRVVAPYATGLALMVNPRDALLNLQAIDREGGAGEFGYYDAIDYTTTRLAPNETKHVLRCYFAHHQGMLLAALDNCLFEGAMQRRFHREPRVRAAEWLLQERVPIVTSVITPHGDEMTTAPVVREPESSTSRWLTTPHTVSPRAHLLSNGNYTVMMTNAGGGYSNCREIRLTRWQSDRTCDNWGQFLYLRDRQNGNLWSPTYQPTQRLADDYEVLFSVDKAEFRRRDDELETRLEVAVVPDTDAEVRLLTIVNYGTGERTIEVTSFAEIALCPADADLAHPAFQKLFIETEYLAPHRALLARRRPRSVEEQPRWAAHVLAVDDSHLDQRHDQIEYETDRAKFLGRGGTVAAPAACAQRGPLSGTVGPVLDPVFSLRCTVRVPPGESVRLAFTTAYATTRDQVLAMADQFHELRVVQGAFELAWAHAQVALRHVHLTAGKIHLFQRLSSLLLYPDATKRAPEATIAANRQGQPGLWRYGVSGDFPLVLVRITHPEQDGLVRELLLAHEFWRSKNFIVELVILNEHPTSYVDAIQEHLNRLLSESGSHGLLNQRGGVFVLQATRIPEEEQTLLMAVATVVLHGADGSLESQLETTPVRKRLPDLLSKRTVAPARVRRETPPPPAHDKSALFPNRLGQFSADGREYIVHLSDNTWTPAPWSNVIANASLGCIVTDSGSGYTWFGNSRENKLTSWSNDPIRDTPSEAIYVRDEETGEFWSPTPLPIREPEPYTVRHGQGYTRFEHTSHGIEMDLLVTVAEDDPVKLLRLKLRNTSGRPRELSVTAVVEWVLGVHRQQTQMHVITSLDPATQALLAMNHYNHEFAGHVAFLQVVGRPHTVTGDRTEVFGRNGSWTKPAALDRKELSGRVGAAFDPCGAVQTKCTIQPGQETEIVFLLGEAANRDDVNALLGHYSELTTVHRAIDDARESWDALLSTVQVDTPSTALNLLVNRWLLYQTLSCRIWGRSGFYQASGAFGFRDQLQDSLALVYSRPELLRAHLLYAASRQYEEGDVQHWWHPPSGRGVRTRFSDDFLWLPFAAAFYVEKTGDSDVLRELVPFIQSALLEPHEHERYEMPKPSPHDATLYNHCVRAIEYGLRFGDHGLPLMGCGDWNDGMSTVGIGGRGESVWVGWFMVDILGKFAPIAESMGESDRAATWRAQRARLLEAIEAQAWDGEWYRRAYFDDGTPLGSALNDACQIDSLPQSWSVIAGGDPQRARQGMEAAWERLVRLDDRMVCLFQPPFDKTELQPGYIKGYLPGIRENGGQYTHGALWMVEAWARLGEGNRALQLYELLAPQHHTDDDPRLDQYKVEPYVVAADIYGESPHRGRGGWTWYTGSAAWMYRVALEQLLGFRLHDRCLQMDPCIPAAWEAFTVTYRHNGATFRIRVENPEHVERGVKRVTCDGVECPLGAIPLSTASGEHEVRVVMGKKE